MGPYETLVDDVMHWTGIHQRPTAERALKATVIALGGSLPLDDRERWSAGLPGELRALWHAAPQHQTRTAAALYAAVPAAEGVPQPYATEHAQAVVRVLAARLADSERQLIARHLPDDVAELVRTPALIESEYETGQQAPAQTAHGSTLATGASGSGHPISSARPDRAQSGSVAAADPARMDRSLGAGRGRNER